MLRAVVSKRATVAAAQRRTLVTATKPKMGGDHGEHKVFDGKHFSAFQAGTVVWGVAFLGVAIPLASVKYQNKKHGFA